MSGGKTVGLYVRVSTQDQSCELQRRELKEFAQARGWKIYEIYEDKRTGTNSDREALKQCMNDARLRKYDIFLCWKLDRVARSLKDLISIIQELKELNVSFASLKDAVDLSTSSGRLMLHIIGAFAQFEADIIKERVRAGLANAKSKGIRLGRPQQVSIVRVSELHKRGYSLGRIGKELGVSKSAIWQAVKKSPIK